MKGKGGPSGRAPVEADFGAARRRSFGLSRQAGTLAPRLGIPPRARGLIAVKGKRGHAPPQSKMGGHRTASARVAAGATG